VQETDQIGRDFRAPLATLVNIGQLLGISDRRAVPVRIGVGAAECLDLGRGIETEHDLPDVIGVVEV
jgi:hypothetical protein